MNSGVKSKLSAVNAFQRSTKSNAPDEHNKPKSNRWGKYPAQEHDSKNSKGPKFKCYKCDSPAHMVKDCPPNPEKKNQKGKVKEMVRKKEVDWELRKNEQDREQVPEQEQEQEQDGQMDEEDEPLDEPNDEVKEK